MSSSGSHEPQLTTSTLRSVGEIAQCLYHRCYTGEDVCRDEDGVTCLNALNFSIWLFVLSTAPVLTNNRGMYTIIVR